MLSFYLLLRHSQLILAFLKGNPIFLQLLFALLQLTGRTIQFGLTFSQLILKLGHALLVLLFAILQLAFGIG
ncbi:hypothetical protein D3C74_280960 [compost metagenome]